MPLVERRITSPWDFYPLVDNVTSGNTSRHNSLNQWHYLCNDRRLIIWYYSAGSNVMCFLWILHSKSANDTKNVIIRGKRKNSDAFPYLTQPSWHHHSWKFIHIPQSGMNCVLLKVLWSHASKGIFRLHRPLIHV